MKKINKTATFNGLIAAIRKTNNKLTEQASKAVNISLTLRNWLIGYYIAKYELKGLDRAGYGKEFYNKLSASLAKYAVPGINPRELRRYRMFYKIYPQIWQTVSPKLQLSASDLGVTVPQIKQKTAGNDTIITWELVEKLSFSHITELIAIEDATKRRFYEVECIRGSWSVRELERQINSLYYERSGLSKNKKKLSAITQAKAKKQDIKLNIRDPYVFEFLGLKAKETMAESQVEDALIDKLQEFLLELGHGFCFEARQKRILIGEENGFIDLVFYHRVLKCHVLVELKLGKFSHENVGQLNTYVSWYKKNMMEKGDNPPVGILLCTKKDHALVSYALAGMDNKLFVSKYKLELPKKEEMERFIKQIMPKG
ncbi:MAG: cytoplasmic protein [Candidatus Goldiibacteriota bacterium HGW-Goldbacteria-1]|jgi:predicted nuclease of restriction endonuclease-like (RecB) superfamily|nr:MAG: cytoplasmic protein [Candidatus Goldiibacteriota bacterium HGW-Goldbacteria-1]